MIINKNYPYVYFKPGDLVRVNWGKVNMAIIKLYLINPNLKDLKHVRQDLLWYRTPTQQELLECPNLMFLGVEDLSREKNVDQATLAKAPKNEITWFLFGDKLLISFYHYEELDKNFIPAGSND